MEWQRCVVVLFGVCAALPNTIYVSPSGSDVGADGSSVSPYKTIGKAVEQLQGGDILTIRAGTYKETITLPRAVSGTAENPTVIQGVHRDSVVIDGEYELNTLFNADYSDYIHLKRITFRRTYCSRVQGSFAAVRTSMSGHGAEEAVGWLFEDLVIEDNYGCGLGLCDVRDGVLRRVLLQRNSQLGMGGWNCHDVLISWCTFRDNNYGTDFNPWPTLYGNGTDPNLNNLMTVDSGKWYVMPAFESGGCKLLESSKITLEYFTGNDNHGPGFWFDAGNSDCVIRKSEFFNNKSYAVNRWGNVRLGGHGFMIEFNPAGNFKVDSCYFHDNDAYGCYVAETPRVTVTNSIVANCKFAIREAPEASVNAFDPVNDLLVERNIFINTIIDGDKMPRYWNADSIAAKNIVFKDNQWQGEEPKMVVYCWTDPEEAVVWVYGLPAMRERWGTFLSDTYTPTISPVNWSMPSTVLLPGVERRIAVPAEHNRPMGMFDTRGRLICSTLKAGGQSGFPAASSGVFIVAQPQVVNEPVFSIEKRR